MISPKGPSDFFRYLSPSGDAERWGVSVTAGGRCHSRPGAVYPPLGHPADHGFTWSVGRVLGAYQFLMIRAGAGRFESTDTGEVALKEGTGVLLFPGVWHRYQPSPATGWNEQWIELRGPVPQALARSRVFTPRTAVFRPADPIAIELLMDRVLERLEAGGARPDPLAGAWALEILARLQAARIPADPPKPIAVAVARAERILAAHLHGPPSLENVAKELGVAYSYLRREFRQRTGLAPKQYLQRLRLEKAQRLLGTTSHTLQTIADELGFSSPFHFSAAFKAQFGVAPDKWRRGHAGTRPRNARRRPA